MHICELDWDRSAVLLPPGCYLNHSCDPNAMRSGVKVFAWKPIRAGSEITIDYRLNAFDGDSWPCACGAEGCSGTVVGSFFALPPERQAAYVRFAPQFIKREYRRRRGSVNPRRVREAPRRRFARSARNGLRSGTRSRDPPQLPRQIPALRHLHALEPQPPLHQPQLRLNAARRRALLARLDERALHHQHACAGGRP